MDPVEESNRDFCYDGCLYLLDLDGVAACGSSVRSCKRDRSDCLCLRVAATTSPDCRISSTRYLRPKEIYGGVRLQYACYVERKAIPLMINLRFAFVFTFVFAVTVLFECLSQLAYHRRSLHDICTGFYRILLRALVLVTIFMISSLVWFKVGWPTE